MGPKIVIVDYNSKRLQLVKDVLAWLGEELVTGRFVSNLPANLDLSECVLFSWHVNNANSDELRKQEESTAERAGELGIRKACKGLRMWHTGAEGETASVDVKERKGECSFLHDLVRLLKYWGTTREIPPVDKAAEVIAKFFTDKTVFVRNLVPLDILIQGALLSKEKNGISVSSGSRWWDSCTEDLRNMFEKDGTSEKFVLKDLGALGIPTRADVESVLSPLDSVCQEKRESNFMKLIRRVAGFSDADIDLEDLLDNEETLKELHSTFEALCRILCE